MAGYPQPEVVLRTESAETGRYEVYVELSGLGKHVTHLATLRSHAVAEIPMI
jgi:hypothetical protein